MYEVGRKPTKSQAYARVICHIAVKERGLSIEALSETDLNTSQMRHFCVSLKNVMPDSVGWVSVGGLHLDTFPEVCLSSPSPLR